MLHPFATMVETTEHKRKQLIFRSWHRGTREMDMIMGRFADQFVPEFSDNELEIYEDLLQVPDPDIYDWICGRADVPANYDNNIVKKLIEHKTHVR